MSVRFRRRIELVPGWSRAGLAMVDDSDEQVGAGGADVAVTEGAGRRRAVVDCGPAAARVADPGLLPATILRERTREPVDWEAQVAARGPYQPRPYSPPKASFSAESVAWEAARRVPLWPLTVLVFGALWLTMTVSNQALQILAALPGLAAAIWVWRVPRRRAELRQRLLEERQARYEADVELERAEHESAEAERAAEWAEEERRRALLRDATAGADPNPEPLADVLSAELSGLCLPVRLAVEFEFQGADRLLIELEYADAGPAPEPFTAGGVHAPDIICATALRVVHETLRTLPVIGTVEVVGKLRLPDSTGGPARSIPALHVAVEREALRGMELDDVAPAAAIEALGGLLGFDADGVARALDRVPGWADEG